MFEDQTILITGGTGSWGTELTAQLLQLRPKHIRIFSRNEFNQVNMQRRFHGRPELQYRIGDIRDYQAVEEACRGVDYVFHLAALKHVPICESQPDEAMKTNVIGTENIIRAAIAAKVKKVIDVSTDKAAEPINFYGISKLVGERLIIHANGLGTDTRFVCIRGGNVLGTNGSVVPFFMKQIAEGRNVTLTSREMTRFFSTVTDTVGLLVKASQLAAGGEIFVLKMPACRIEDLAQVLIDKLADAPVGIEEIGIRPGEKLHEVLVTRYESPTTYDFSDEYYVVLPSVPSTALIRRYEDYPRAAFEKYESNDRLLTPAGIESLLVRGGFLP
ncbi:polysaccharide biosynthesis protein [Paenibacillus sp. S-38]|uniref:polysaccharide biosynthesis protein n=1 Tax=Paenibacillus sp. S-38 TaxID=3416710 RepID=UPI003CF78930